MNRRAIGAGLLVVAACASGPSPQPFDGPAPLSIAILPLDADGLPQGLVDLLEEHVASSVRERGYAVVAPAVMATAVPRGSRLDRELLQEIRRAFGVEAVMVRVARPRSETGGADGFTVQWVVIATQDGKTLWSRRESVSSRTMTGRHLTVGIQGEAASDPFLSDEPVVGRGSPKWVTEDYAVTPAQQAESLQHALAARLPLAPPQS